MAITTHIFVAVFVASLCAVSQGQYYGSQNVPTGGGQATQQQTTSNAEAWRRWYKQQADYQKQLAAYNAAQAARKQPRYQTPAASGSQQQQAAYRTPTAQQQKQAAAASAYAARQQAATAAYSRQPTAAASTSTSQQRYPAYAQQQQQQQQTAAQQQQQRYQQYYQQQQQQQQYSRPTAQQQYNRAGTQPANQATKNQGQQWRRGGDRRWRGRGRWQNGRRQQRVTPPPPRTTTPMAGEIEFEYENPTTTTTAAPYAAYNAWGQYNAGKTFPSLSPGTQLLHSKPQALQQQRQSNQLKQQQRQPRQQISQISQQHGVQMLQRRRKQLVSQLRQHEQHRSQLKQQQLQLQQQQQQKQQQLQLQQQQQQQQIQLLMQQQEQQRQKVEIQQSTKLQRPRQMLNPGLKTSATVVDLSAMGVASQPGLNTASPANTLKPTRTSPSSRPPLNPKAPGSNPRQGGKNNVPSATSLIQNLKGVAAGLARAALLRSTAPAVALTQVGGSEFQISGKPNSSLSPTSTTSQSTESKTETRLLSRAGQMGPATKSGNGIASSDRRSSSNNTSTAISLMLKTQTDLLSQLRKPSQSARYETSRPSLAVVTKIGSKSIQSFSSVTHTTLTNGGALSSASRGSDNVPNNTPSVEDLLSSYIPKARSVIATSPSPNTTPKVLPPASSSSTRLTALGASLNVVFTTPSSMARSDTSLPTREIARNIFTTTREGVTTSPTSRESVTTSPTSRESVITSPTSREGVTISSAPPSLTSDSSITSPTVTNSLSPIESSSTAIVLPQGSATQTTLVMTSTEPTPTTLRDPTRERLIATIMSLTREIKNLPVVTLDSGGIRSQSNINHYGTTFGSSNVSSGVPMTNPAISLSVNNPSSLDSGGGSRSRTNVVPGVNSNVEVLSSLSVTNEAGLSGTYHESHQSVQAGEYRGNHPQNFRPLAVGGLGNEPTRIGYGGNSQYLQNGPTVTPNNYPNQGIPRGQSLNSFGSPSGIEDLSLLYNKLLNIYYNSLQTPVGRSLPTSTTAPPTTTPHPYRDLFLDYYRDKHFAHISSYTVPDYAAGQPATIKSPASQKPGAKTLKASPARLSSLLGDLAVKLAKNAAKQDLKAQTAAGGGPAYSLGSSLSVPAPTSAAAAGRSGSLSPASSSTQPGNSKSSEFAGLLDLTPQQQTQFNVGRWGGPGAMPAAGASPAGYTTGSGATGFGGSSGGAASNQPWQGASGGAPQGPQPTGQQPQGQGSGQSSSGFGVDLSWPAGQPVPMATAGAAAALQQNTGLPQGNQWAQQPSPQGPGVLSPNSQQPQPLPQISGVLSPTLQQQQPSPQGPGVLSPTLQQQQPILQDWTNQPSVQQQNQPLNLQGPAPQQIPTTQLEAPFQQRPPPQDQLIGPSQSQQPQQTIPQQIQGPPPESQNPPPYDLSLPAVNPSQSPQQPPFDSSPNNQQSFVPPLDLSQIGSLGQGRIPPTPQGGTWDQAGGGGGALFPLEQTTAIPPLDLSGGQTYGSSATNQDYYGNNQKYAGTGQGQGYGSQNQGYYSQNQGYNSQSQGYNSQGQGYNPQSQGYSAGGQYSQQPATANQQYSQQYSQQSATNGQYGSLQQQQQPAASSNYGYQQQQQQSNQQYGPNPNYQNPNTGAGQDPFDVNGLQPTVFNPSYKNQGAQQQFGSPAAKDGGFGDLLGPQNAMSTGSSTGGFGQNMMAPQGKMDFSAKGPNPIQLNQFMAQPSTPKESNTAAMDTTFDALLGKLLSSTGVLQQQQMAQAKPTTTTTTTPAPLALNLGSRLKEFVLGPQREFRENAFSRIPESNAQYDSMNPLAAFMGEKPPPPSTTTPAPPGRNGDFLAGFIGVNDPVANTATVKEQRPNIYFYNHLPQTTPAPAKQQSAGTGSASSATSSNSALSNLGTEDLHTMVHGLMKVLAMRRGVTSQG